MGIIRVCVCWWNACMCWNYIFENSYWTASNCTCCIMSYLRRYLGKVGTVISCNIGTSIQHRQNGHFLRSITFSAPTRPHMSIFSGRNDSHNQRIFLSISLYVHMYMYTQSHNLSTLPPSVIFAVQCSLYKTYERALHYWNNQFFHENMSLEIPKVNRNIIKQPEMEMKIWLVLKKVLVYILFNWIEISTLQQHLFA